MSDEMIGIRVHFDAETGEVRIAAKDVAKLGRQVDRAGKDMARADRAAKGWLARLKAAHPVMAKVAKYAVPALGVAGLVSGLKSLGRHVVDSGVRMEGWQSRLLAATGSGHQAAREIGFLREQAERLGLDFGALADSYSGFANATKGTALAGEQTRKVFVGVAEAAAVMRLSAADTEGVMRALEQMVSKGTVSAEELRGQLGERLAGAFQIAARAMGTTTEELGQLLQQGKIAAEDLLPKLAAQLRVEFGSGLDAATNSAQANFARLANAFDDLGNAVAESGLLDWLGDLAGAAAAAVRMVSGTAVTDARSVQERLADARERLAATGTGERYTAAQRNRRGLESDESIRKGIRREIAALERVLPENLDATIAGVRADLDAALAELEKLPGSGRTKQQINRHGATEEDKARTAAQKRVKDHEADLARLEELHAQRRAEQEAAAAAVQRKREAEEARQTAEAAKAAEEAAKADEARRAEMEQLIDAMGRVAAAEEELSNVQRARAELEGRRAAGEDVDGGQAARLLAAAHAADQRAQAERELAGEIRAREEIEDARSDLAGPYEAARIEAKRWEAELLALVAHNKDLAQAVQDVTDARLRAIDRAEADAGTGTGDGEAGVPVEFVQAAREGMEQWAADSADLSGSVAASISGAFQSAGAELARFVTTGKAQFGDLASSIVADLTRIVLQQQLARIVSAFIPGGGASATVQHGGGVVGGVGGVRREVSPLLFAGAPRLHGGGVAGLRRDEVPTILQVGETVMPKGARLAGPQVTVQVINEGTPQQVVDQTQRVDGEKMVVSIVVRDIQERGPIGRAVEHQSAQR